MNIKKLKHNDKGFYYYKTDEFVTIKIRYYFNYENIMENYVKAMILSEYLLKTNKIYKTSKEITDRTKELYCSNVSIYRITFGIKAFMCFELNMVNPRVIEEDYFTDAINFYKDIMLNPNIKNNKLDSTTLNLIKSKLIDKMNEAVKTPSIMNERLFYKNVIPTSKINNHIFSDKEEFEKIINNIKDVDIIDFYNQLMNNFVCGIAFGNLLDDEIKLIQKTFDFKKIDFDYKYDFKDDISDNDIEIVNNETTQSYLYFVYEIKDYKKQNSYLYDALITMLSSNIGPIYNIYRTKLGIIYSGYAEILYNYGLFYIKLDIDKKNKEKAISNLKEVFDILHEPNEIKKLLKYTKEKEKELVNAYSENVNQTINEIENIILNYDLSYSKKLDLINSLNVDDIIKQIDNLEYKCMYYYVGDKSEK